MIVNPSIVASAKHRGRRALASSTLPGESFTTVDAVVDLLSGRCSPAAQSAARRLLSQMAASPWEVVRGAHRSVDHTLHVLVEVAGTRYHLRLDNKSCVFDITAGGPSGPERHGGRRPWSAPGT